MYGVVGYGDGMAECTPGDGNRRPGQLLGHLRQFPHAGHKRRFSRALNQADSAVAPVQHAADFFSDPTTLVSGRSPAGRGCPALHCYCVVCACTPFPQRTDWAAGLARQAHSCAEFHHGLIEIPGPGTREQCLGMLPGLWRGEFAASHFNADQSLQNTLDIAIDNGHGLAKGNAGDGSCGVASDAGESLEGCGCLREAASVFSNQFSGALMQPVGAAVVAETAPSGEHGVFRSNGEGSDIREALKERTVVVNDGGHPRLLQHDFAEPDAIGVASLAPGKIAAMLVVPAKQRAPESGQVLAARWNWRRGEPRKHGVIVP